MTDITEMLEANSPLPEDGIGGRIKEARLRGDYDLSVEALSRLCREYDVERQGITPTTLLRYEQGKVKPGARELRILCDALDVSADWLLFGAENPAGLSLAEGLSLLSRIIDEKDRADNLWRRRRGAADIVRSGKIAQAKVPQKRG